MTYPAVFHLSFPVSSLAASLAFYESGLGAKRGRSTGAWVDLVVFGHQLTLHEQPAQVLPRAARGVRHFGAILQWPEFEALRRRLEVERLDPAPSFVHRDAGRPTEHSKLLVEDPDGNLIEVKACRHATPVELA